MKIAIMAMDPGGTTGVAWGIFDTDHRSVASMLQLREAAGSESIQGISEQQIPKLADIWKDFSRESHSEHELSLQDIELVMEDWQVRPRIARTGKVPVIPVQIAWGVLGYRMGRSREYEEGGWGPTNEIQVIWQQPGQAMSFGTKQRLQKWNCWVVGRPHERTAWQHIAVRLSHHVR
jgi:hypothetical protein